MEAVDIFRQKKRNDMMTESMSPCQERINHNLKARIKTINEILTKSKMIKSSSKDQTVSIDEEQELYLSSDLKLYSFGNHTGNKRFWVCKILDHFYSNCPKLRYFF